MNTKAACGQAKQEDQLQSDSEEDHTETKDYSQSCQGGQGDSLVHQEPVSGSQK